MFEAHLLCATPRFSTENDSEWCKPADGSTQLEEQVKERALDLWDLQDLRDLLMVQPQAEVEENIESLCPNIPFV